MIVELRLIFVSLIFLSLLLISGCDASEVVSATQEFEIVENDLKSHRGAFICKPDSLGQPTAICIINSETNGELVPVIIYKKGNPYLSGPTWSPNSNYIAFLCKTKSRYQICVVDANGKEPLTIPTEKLHTISASHPIWSPDGTKILFNCNSTRKKDDNKTMICTISLDGDLQTWPYGVDRITRSHYMRPSREPRWSPDGKQISYICDTKNITGICIFNSDGSGSIVNLSNSTAEEGTSSGNPAWSPGNRHIVYQCSRDICVIDTHDPNNMINLSDMVGYDTGGDASPRYSPDGSKIIYHCGSFSIGYADDITRWCIVNADGSGKRLNITESLRGLGYQDTMVVFQDNNPIAYNCRGYDPITCRSLGTRLGNVYDLLDTIETFRDVDITAYCARTERNQMDACDELEATSSSNQ